MNKNKLIFGLVFLLFVSFASANILSSDFLLNWGLDEGSGTAITDESGNGAVATNVGADWDTTFVKLGTSSLDFIIPNNDRVYNDTTGFVTLPETGGSADFTLNHWYLDNSSQYGSQICIANGTADNKHIIDFLINANGGSAVKWYYVGDSGASAQPTYTGPGWGDTNWHMATLVVDSTNSNLTFYFDSVKAKSLSISGNEWTSEDIVMGLGMGDSVNCDSDLSFAYVNSTLDEVSLFSKALSTAEVSDLYNSGNGKQYDDYASDTTPPVITENTYNLTSAINEANRTIWRTDKTESSITIDSTPSLTFDVSEASNCSIGLLDTNYTNMTNDDANTKCGTTDTTSHTCTLPSTSALSEGLQYIYVSCIDNSGNENTTGSTSGALKVVLDSTPPVVALESPSDNSYNSSLTITFRSHVTDVSLPITNCSLWTNESGWSLKQSNLTITNDTDFLISNTFSADGRYSWNTQCCDEGDNCGFNETGNYTLNLDTTSPSIDYNSDTSSNATWYSLSNILVNLTVSDNSIKYSFIDYDNSLKGWWHLDGNSTDKSGNGNDGDNGATVFEVGKFSKAMSFDGIGDSINVTSSETLNINGDMTISAWVKPNDVSSISRIVYKNIDGDNSYQLVILGGGELGMGIQSGVGNYIRNKTTANEVQSGDWYMITGVLEDNQIRLYINGTETSSYTSTTISTLGSSTDLIIGASGSGSSKFNGVIDEVLLFNRSLSSDEVQALYGNSVFYRNFTEQSDGNHTFKSYVVDGIGNINETEERVIYLDSTDPIISFIDYTSNSTTYYQDWIALNTSSFDASSGVETVCKYIYNDSLVLESSNCGTDGELNQTLSDGTYYINATVNDTAGNLNWTETRTIILSSNVPLTINGTYVYNITTLLGGTTNFKIFVDDTDGFADIENVTLQISGKEFNISNNDGVQWWYYNLSINDSYLGLNEMNITASDGSNTTINNLGGRLLNITDGFSITNTTYQNSYSTIILKNSTHNITYLNQIAVVNRNLREELYNYNLTLPLYANSNSISLINGSGSSIDYNYSISTRLLNFSVDSLKNTTSIYNLTYKLEIVNTTQTVGSCTGTTSGTCTYSFNVTNWHDHTLDNIILKLESEDMSHFNDNKGNIEVYFDLVDGTGGGDYEKSVLIASSSNFIFFNYRWESGIIYTQNDVDVGEGLSSSNETNATYSISVTNSSDNYIDFSNFTLGSITTTQDLGANSTYTLKFIYSYDTLAQGSGGIVGGGGGGGGLTITQIEKNIINWDVNPSSVDKFVLIPIPAQNISYSLTLNVNQQVTDCYSEESDFTCVNDGDSVILLYNEPNFKNFFGKIIKTNLVLTNTAGEIKRVPINLRVINLGYYLNTREFSLPGYLSSNWLFKINSSGKIVGIRYWEIAVILLIIGILWYRSRKHKNKKE